MLDRIEASLIEQNMVMPSDLPSIYVCTAGFIEAWTDHILKADRHRRKMDVTIDMEVEPDSSVVADIKNAFNLGRELLRKSNKAYNEYQQSDDLPDDVVEMAKFIVSHVLNRSLAEPLNKPQQYSGRNGHIRNIALACTYSVFYLLNTPPPHNKKIKMSARDLFDAHPALVDLHTFIIKCLTSDDVLGRDFTFWHLVWLEKKHISLPLTMDKTPAGPSRRSRSPEVVSRRSPSPEVVSRRSPSPMDVQGREPSPRQSSQRAPSAPAPPSPRERSQGSPSTRAPPSPPRSQTPPSPSPSLPSLPSSRSPSRAPSPGQEQELDTQGEL
ncbi:hypothetical protein FB107DRAFT_280994 [Schizophyllum commune]